MARATRRHLLLASLVTPLLAAEDHGPKPAPAHDAKPAAKAEAKPEAKPEPKPSAFGDPKHAPPKPEPAKAPVKQATHARPKPKPRPDPTTDSAHAEDRPPPPEYTIPGNVLPDLIAGNRRFVSGRPTHPRLTPARVFETSLRGEQPRACILTCADSRVPPELLFDQGIGDLHTVRVAGNIAGHTQIASIELALEMLNTPVCVVLGHTGCTAVSGVVNGQRVSESAQQLLKPITNAVARTRKYNPALSGSMLVNECVRVNVWQTIEDLLQGSDMIAARVRSGILRLSGAIYHTGTGVVEWLGSYPGALSILR